MNVKYLMYVSSTQEESIAQINYVNCKELANNFRL